MLNPAAISRVLDHFLPNIRSHLQRNERKVFILAVTGLQGSGKSTWAQALVNILNTQHGISTRAVSLDDFYHDHDNLVAIREASSDNPLLRMRGLPGTHDEELARNFFSSLKPGGSETVSVPSFDKSRFNGEGDRAPKESWDEIPSEPPLDVLIFEGWCLGFQPLSNEEVEARWKAASGGDGTLGKHDLRHLLAINENLRRYCSTFMGPQRFDGMLQLSTTNLQNVYRWRLDQEHASIARRGTGMTDVEVTKFVDGYMPAYELYLKDLSSGMARLSKQGKKHVRVLLDVDRVVTSVQVLE